MKRFVCVGGLLLSLCANLGCAATQPPKPSLEVVVRTEIKKFYQWLSGTRQLLHRVPSYGPTRPEKRRLDPETLELVPERKTPRASTEKIIEGLNELLRNPEYQKRREQMEELAPR
jgi:hypothetical protein